MTLRKMAAVSFAALVMSGAMASQAWAPPKINPSAAPSFNLKGLGNIPGLNLNAIPDVPAAPGVKNTPNPPNYGQLPGPAKQPDVPNYDAPDTPLNPLNYGKLAPEAPSLNYTKLAPEPSAPMGKLPPPYDVVPPNPNAANVVKKPPSNPIGKLPADPNAATVVKKPPSNPIGKLPADPNVANVVKKPPSNPIGKLPADPNAANVVKKPPSNPIGKLPADPNATKYGKLPSNPPAFTPKKSPADELADKIGLDPNHPGRLQANKITSNVGVQNPPMRARGPAPANLDRPPPAMRPTQAAQGMSTAKKVLIGGVVSLVVLTGAGVSTPFVVQAITGEDVPDKIADSLGIPE